ncbi:MAG: phosphotransferase [Alphaproteobacteria bacterium]|nr:phosphotransferase [Alphaproteobacteria bacterium]
MRERWQRTSPVLNVTPREAEALLRPALGDTSVVAVEPLSGGLSNTNLRARLADGSSLVLRLYQRDPTQARKEAAISALIGSKVPVPRYHHVGERESNGQTYAVVEWIDATALQPRLRHASDDDLRIAGHAIGTALAGIHSFTFAEPGFLGADLKTTPFPGGASSSKFLEMCFAGLAGERVGRDFADEVLAYAKANEARSAIWQDPPRLTHFDFGSSNILVRADFSLAAVVDWEFAAGASPSADFGNLLRAPLGTRDAFVAAVEQGYRDAGGFLPDDWRDLVRLADIGAWAEFLSRPNAPEVVIEDARQVLRQTIGRR